MGTGQTDKWVKKWQVEGSNGHAWTVAIDKKGNYGCSCPVWKFKRQECHHIKQVKMNGGEPIISKESPEYVLAMVNKPIYEEETNRLLVPLIGLPDAIMMQATICFYMLKYGYSMGEIRAIRRVPASWSARAIIAHVEQHGEAEYPEGWYTH